MNWVIKSNRKIKFQTNLKEVLKPIWNDLKNYKWIFADIDFNSINESVLNFDQDYFILTNKDVEKIMENETQIIWGVISIVPKNSTIDENEILKINAESSDVWKNGKFQLNESIIEITAFDSGYTIVKFKDESLSKKFKNYFENEAIELQKIK